MQDINRLKLVLVEKKRTNKWLSEQLGINLQLCLNGVPIPLSQIWKL